MWLGTLAIPAKAIRSMPRRRGWSYASHDVIEGPPKSQFIAPGAPELTLSLFLHASFCEPKAILDALVALADAGEVCVLQSESGTIHGQFVIEGVSDDPKWTLPDGTLVAVTVDVTLSDPGLDGVLAIAEPKPLATSGNAADVQSNEPAEDRSRAANDVTPAEIARR